MKHLFVGGPADGEVRHTFEGSYCVVSANGSFAVDLTAVSKGTQVVNTDYHPMRMVEKGVHHTLFVCDDRSVISRLIEGYLPTELNLPDYMKDFVNYASKKEIYIDKFNSALAELNIPVPDPSTTKYKLLLAVYLKGIQTQ